MTSSPPAMPLAYSGRIRPAGVTLVELMVAIAILAILLAAAAPSFVDFYDRYRVRGAADEIASLVGNARAAAVKLDREVRVTYSNTGDGWCLGARAADAPAGGRQTGTANTPCVCGSPVASDDACNVGGEIMESPRGRHAGVSVTTPGDIFFDGQLGVTRNLDAGAFELASPSEKHFLEVRVSPLGNSTICVPKGPAIPGVPACAGGG